MKKYVLGSIGIMFLAGCSLFMQTVATPTFSPGSGVYTNSVTVSVNCTTEDAIIKIKREVTFYSNTNLFLPPAVIVTDDWQEYTDALTFRTNSLYVVVKISLFAYAEKEEMKPSSTNSATYELRK